MPVPVDLSNYPGLQNLVDTVPAYRRLWLDGNWPPGMKQAKRPITPPPLSPVRGGKRPNPDAATGNGPGSQLKRLLRKVGVMPTAKCGCNNRAKLMDRNGPDWCEQNLELVVDWLEEEAKRRHLPFVRLAGKALVKLAIRNARKQVQSSEEAFR